MVALAGSPPLGDDERLVDKPQEPRQHIRPVYGLDRVQREAADEDRQAAEERLFAVVEQLVAPIDRRTQGPVPGDRGPAAVAQQAEAVFQPRSDLR